MVAKGQRERVPKGKIEVIIEAKVEQEGGNLSKFGSNIQHTIIGCQLKAGKMLPKDVWSFRGPNVSSFYRVAVARGKKEPTPHIQRVSLGRINIR